MGNNADFYQRAAEKRKQFILSSMTCFFYMDGLKSQELKESWLLGQSVCLQQGAVCFHSGRGFLKGHWHPDSEPVSHKWAKTSRRHHVAYCGKELKANLRRCTLLHTPTYSDLKQHLCFLMRLRVFVQSCGYY